MKIGALGLAGIAVAMSAIPAFAHHSFAMFDAEKKLTLDGTVKEFQWTNPHSWILMTVNNAQGQPEQWAIEMGLGTAGLGSQDPQARHESPDSHPSAQGRIKRRAIHGDHASRRNPNG